MDWTWPTDSKDRYAEGISGSPGDSGEGAYWFSGRIMGNKIVSKCVNCGYCRRTAPCGWGEMKSGKDKSCRFLIPDPSRPGRWLCGIYDKIVGQPTSEISPAFGAGCCSTLNSDRRKILEGV